MKVSGFKVLPGQNGHWGHFLQEVGLPGRASTSPGRAVQWIDESSLVFAGWKRPSNRGFLFVLSLVASLPLISMAINVALTIESWAQGWPHLILLVTLYAGGAIGCLASACHLYRKPAEPPVVLSRRLGKFYYWVDTKRGWVSLDYDAAVPISRRDLVRGKHGSTPVQVLAVVELTPGSRQIDKFLPLSEPELNDAGPEELWEFIRHYMNGNMRTLPQVAFAPTTGGVQADLARMERLVFDPWIDPDHRVKGLSGWLSVLFLGSLMFWFELAGFWLLRHAPRVAWPDALASELDSLTMKAPLNRSACSQQRTSEERAPRLWVRWLLPALFNAVIVLAPMVLLALLPWTSGNA
ncbi:hypothetical protein I5U23_14980 [Stenotrophomonas maltophilia]|uniref:Transmembrane protein n=1 Tax=Stenotrophomonas riyadhensis TaxID=2859893 RepID=A0ABT2XDI8_9GAMM|nr:hypothetical protein [Stenotrophomonas sp. CFS3442]MBH1619221.1 hypothetical protein [Stenotrophomonas maltophilia]MCV0323989.1 hypothetical protein [Stenotrophomonas sp. CFS3442]HEL4243615.1 hypothetical protein [Stenotrophomonas maltophilia]